MQVTEATPLAANREEVGDRLAAAPGVLLALDFDGTLAPIVDDPDDATLAPGLRERLVDLAARPSVAPAVVSGRALDDLQERVGIEGLYYAGNHGLELRYEDEEFTHPDAREGQATIDRVCDELADRLADVPGVRIENKGLTATVHVRQVPDKHVAEVEETTRETVEEIDDSLAINPGKAIQEIRPPVDWNKGHAVDLLTDETPEDWVTVFVGDDVTDEDAFAALDDDGIGVLVGDRETAADYRVGDHEGVGDLLALVEDRYAE